MLTVLTPPPPPPQPSATLFYIPLQPLLLLSLHHLSNQLTKGPRSQMTEPPN